MNIIEVAKKENVGKKYEITIGNENEGIWELKETYRANVFDFYKNGNSLSGCYYTSQIARMEFEEVVDWATVPVDTKLLVSLDGKHWLKRYFAKYEDGKVYCFDSGATSFSADEENDILAWKYAKLYQE